MTLHRVPVVAMLVKPFLDLTDCSWHCRLRMISTIQWLKLSMTVPIFPIMTPRATTCSHKQLQLAVTQSWLVDVSLAALILATGAMSSLTRRYNTMFATGENNGIIGGIAPVSHILSQTGYAAAGLGQAGIAELV